MDENSFTPGYIKNLSVKLINADGSQIIDIRNLIINISITEDIFQNTLYGSIKIRDATNLLNGRTGFAILGEEFIEIDVEVDWLPQAVNRSLRFAVYSINQIEYGQNNVVKEYVLGICSEEHLIDATTVVMKGYSGKNSDNLKNLLENYLFINQEGPKTIRETQQGSNLFPRKRKKKIDKLQPTKGIQNICIPKLSPLKAAHFLARRSISESTFKSGTYLFFETFNGFNFCDVEYLIQKGIEKAKASGALLNMNEVVSDFRYTYENPVISKSTQINPNEKQTILQMFHKRYFDTIEKMKYGMYESGMLVYDYVNKRTISSVFRFLNNSDKTNNDSMALGDEKEKTFPQNSISFIKRMTSNNDIDAKYSRQFFITKDFSGTNTDTYLDQIYPARASYFARLFQNMFTIDIYGNPNLNAGDVIYIQVPSGNPIVEMENEVNPFISGFYLVGTINHIITATSYQMKCDVFKNAFNSKVETTDESKTVKVTPNDTKALSNSYEEPAVNGVTETQSSNSIFNFFRGL